MADLKRVRLKKYDKDQGHILLDFTHGSQKFVGGKWYRVDKVQAAKLKIKREGQTGNPSQDFKTPYAFDVIDDSAEALAAFEEEERLADLARLAEMGGEHADEEGVIDAKSAKGAKGAKGSEEPDGILAPAVESTGKIDQATGRTLLEDPDDDLADLETNNEPPAVEDDEPVVQPVDVEPTPVAEPPKKDPKTTEAKKRQRKRTRSSRPASE